MCIAVILLQPGVILRGCLLRVGTVMMQFASEGQWGRGIYFAEDAGMLVQLNFLPRVIASLHENDSNGLCRNRCVQAIVTSLHHNVTR